MGGGYSWRKKNHKASFYWLFGSGMLSTENYKKTRNSLHTRARYSQLGARPVNYLIGLVEFREVLLAVENCGVVDGFRHVSDISIRLTNSRLGLP